MAKTPRPRPEPAYNQVFYGYFGEFGSGTDTKVSYVQTAIRPADLDKLTLISDIPGAEAWSVRDLFQREVDVERVTRGLLPYFRNTRQVKFFNPLTLTLLPMSNEDQSVVSELQQISEGILVDDDDIEWTTLELPGVYRFSFVASAPWHAKFEWNDSRGRVVAIDGQHRLSALKRFMKDSETSEAKKEFLDWTIPLVLFTLRKIDSAEVQDKTILDVIRNIFVYINTQAKTPNAARQILLTDESINCICTQELLDYSHSNDLRDPAERDSTRLPLLFFDWRGQEVNGKRVVSEAAVKTIEEVESWFEEYLFGEDFSAQQETALSIQPVDTLKDIFIQQSLTTEAANQVRKVFKERVLPGIAKLLEGFTPYRQYIQALRNLESEYMLKSDLARHAFHELRFGMHHGGDAEKDAIRGIYDEIRNEVGDQKRKIPELIRLDIGMRGVVAAFSEFRPKYEGAVGRSASWEEYASWFVEILNLVFHDGWLSVASDNSGLTRDLLQNVVYDSNNGVVNYRFSDAREGIGVYIVLLVAVYALRDDRIDEGAYAAIWDSYSDRLASTLLKGYRKDARAELRPDFPQGGKPLTDAVKERAESYTQKHIDKVQVALDKIP
ncbi:MAG: hypothetical protein WD002_15650 [Pseudomonadales bacterium]